jgi:putative ABC transport system permease protein
MISQESIKYSLRNLSHRKFRSFLTIFSIFLGITTIFVFISFGLGLLNYIDEFTSSSSADKITVITEGTGAPGLDDTFTLTDKDIRAIEKTSGVFEATGLLSKPAEIEYKNVKKFVFLNGYEPNKPLVLEIGNVGAYKGRLLREGDKGKVLLGYNYQIPDRIFPEALDINDQVKVQGQNAKIVGFIDEIGNPTDDSAIYVTIDYARELYPNATQGFTWAIARADINDLDGVVIDVEKAVRKSRNLEEGEEDFFVASFQDLLESYSSILNIIFGFIILIALISILVSTTNTANTMVTSVLERIKEIGVIKSIGARNSEVFYIFLFESGFLGFLAGVIGVSVGFLITFTAGTILDNLGWGFLSPAYSFSLFAGLILFSTLTGAISGAWPAYQASLTKPVDALRYE